MPGVAVCKMYEMTLIRVFNREPMGQQDQLDLLEILDLLDQMDLKDHQEREVRMVVQEKKDQMVVKETRSGICFSIVSK